MRNSMEKEIKYVGYYDVLRSGKKYRSYSLAGAKKMDYICSELNQLDYTVRIISPSHVEVMGDKKIAAQSEKIGTNCFLELPPSCEAVNKLQRIQRVLKAKVWLLGYLLKNTKRGESVLVYHNYNLAIPVILAQKIRGFQIVLEVEDIYGKVWNLSKLQQWKEKCLLRYVNNDSLVVSDTLAKELEIQNPVISYGSYMICENHSIKVNDGTVKLILTGSVDRERGNGFIAVDAMRYLPENYRLYISGPVAPKDQKAFFDLIRSVNSERHYEACTYLGLLDDDDYKKLLLSADIALNPQKDGEFSRFIFPSKILTYLGYGLPVVSTRGESIVESKLAKIITFADGFDGKSVADAVLNMVPRDRNIYQSYLLNLQRNFQERLKAVFNIEIPEDN